MGKVWSVGLFEELRDKEIPYINKSFKLFSPRRIRKKFKHLHTIADPFLIVFNEDLYLFAETQEHKKLGCINVWKTNDLKEWFNLGLVLEESTHLSYPFVYLDECTNTHYLIPESEKKKEVCLYRFNSFPFELVKICVLLKGNYVDSNLIFKNGIYYLITTNNETKFLEIYFSEKLVSDSWTPHSMNPITANQKIARNGGGFTMLKNQLYRIAQNCEKIYGEGIVFLKVDELTPTVYKETIVISDFKPSTQENWNIIGRHHFSYAFFKSKKIIAIDGIQEDIIANKFINQIFKILSWVMK